MTDTPAFFRLWGIPFVVIGLYLVFGRFFVAAREVNNTWYAVTSKRILIQSGTFRQNFSEFDLATLPYLQLVGLQRDVGTILFAAQNPFSIATIPGWPMNNAQTVPGFQTVSNAREVYEIIKRAQGLR